MFEPILAPAYIHIMTNACFCKNKGILFPSLAFVMRARFPRTGFQLK